MESFFSNKNLSHIPLKRAAYSDRTAWLMAECSRLAYEDLNIDDTRLHAGGFKLHAVIQNQASGTYAYIAKNSNFAVLAFRGTEQHFNDILTDLNIRFYKNTIGKAHAGFVNAYCSVAFEIEKYIRELHDLPIFITGHSLGGALAVIATITLAKDNIAACYTFGCPKVGDKEFTARNNRTPIYRVINAQDIVPYMPISLLHHYEGIGDIHYLSSSNELRYEKSFFDEMKSLLQYCFEVGLDKFFMRHHIEEYCEKLSNLAQKRTLFQKLVMDS